MCVLLSTSIGIQLIYSFVLVSAAQRQSAVCVCVCVCVCVSPSSLVSLLPPPAIPLGRHRALAELPVL